MAKTRAIEDQLNIATPAQFSNDVSPATTAFVQRALGNFSGYHGADASATLTASDFGKLVLWSGSTAGTFTLPAASAGVPGAAIRFFNAGTANVTVQRAGSDTMFMNGGTTTAIALGPGDSLTVIVSNNGSPGVLVLASGSVQLKSSTTFKASIQRPGYQRLPSGLYLQWGTTPASSASAGVSASFPISFPNQCMTVNITPSASSNGYIPAIESSSTSGFTFSMYSNNTTRASGVTAYYIATGF